MVSVRAAAGDRWTIQVVFAGERVSMGGDIPVDASLQQAVLLLADTMSAVLRQLKESVEHQTRMRAEGLTDER